MGSVHAGGEPLSSHPRPELVRCVEAALDKKAENVVVLDLRRISDVTDHFVICHGNSDRQVQAIADGIEEALLRDPRVKPISIEGRRSGEWILLDYVDFVVHVFTADKREFYRLERLWGDAPVVEIPVASTAAATRRSSGG